MVYRIVNIFTSRALGRLEVLKLKRTIIIASALLCLLLSAAWVRSYYRWDTVAIRYWQSARTSTTSSMPLTYRQSHMLTTTTENGRILFARAIGPDGEGKTVGWNARPAKSAGTFSGEDALPGRFGFGYQWFGQLYRDVTMVPFWSLVLLTALLPGFALLRRSR